LFFHVYILAGGLGFIICDVTELMDRKGVVRAVLLFTIAQFMNQCNNCVYPFISDIVDFIITSRD